MAKHIIKLNGTSANSFQVGLQGATISSEAVTAPYTLTLPPSLGSDGQALLLNSSGNLVFGNVSNGATANFANFAGNVTVNAQANITSVGTLTGLTVDGVTSLKGYTETTTTANTGASIAPNVAAGTMFNYTANSNFTFNGFTSPVAGQSATFVITQDATGSRVMSSTMKFVGGSKTLSTAANSTDVICVFYSGVGYYASLTKNYS